MNEKRSRDLSDALEKSKADTFGVTTGELISFSNSTPTTVKRPSSASCLLQQQDFLGPHILTSSTSSYFTPTSTANELEPKPRQKASSLTLEANTYPLTCKCTHKTCAIRTSERATTFRYTFRARNCIDRECGKKLCVVSGRTPSRTIRSVSFVSGQRGMLNLFATASLIIVHYLASPSR